MKEDYIGAPDPTVPGSAYGEGKRSAEMLCTLFHRHYGLETQIARCFAFVGPLLPLDTHFAIGNFIRDALSGSAIRIDGDGTPTRSYLYASDLVVWLWTLLFRAPSARAYNVGSAEELSIKELAEVVAASTGAVSRITCERIVCPTAPKSHYVPNTTRAAQELGLISRVDLPTAIRKTMAWVSESNPAEISIG